MPGEIGVGNRRQRAGETDRARSVQRDVTRQQVQRDQIAGGGAFDPAGLIRQFIGGCERLESEWWTTNPLQREYFRRKLLGWRSELLQESSETLSHLQEASLAEPDIADRASLETDRALELRTRDRERKLISKIDEALRRIEDGTYGYCEETNEPICIKRLEARPIATLSVEAQERHERLERTRRDD